MLPMLIAANMFLTSPHGQSEVTRNSCVSTYDWKVVYSPPIGTSAYGNADWESNSCGFTMQVKSVCQTPPPLNQVYTVYSGEVKGTEIKDQATCDFGSLIDAFLIDSRDTNSWRQLWPAATLLSSLQNKPCFGSSGVELGSANAWECAHKDSDEGGTLYWQQNNSDFEWDLHPDSGNLVVNAITTRISPQNGLYGLTVIVASPEGGCMVIGAGYGQHPTMCANPGKLPHVMGLKKQRSYNDWAEYIGEVAPDCAWMPNGTPGNQTC